MTAKKSHTYKTARMANSRFS